MRPAQTAVPVNGRILNVQGENSPEKPGEPGKVVGEKSGKFVSHFCRGQPAMHAERDIALPILSVCPSVRLSVCASVCPMSMLCLNEWTHRYNS